MVESPWGRPTGVTISPASASPSSRYRRGGATFFSYLNGADAGDGGGESLTHRLFKEAIAGLSGTQLRLQNFGEHAIEITHREMEKRIDTEDGPYYADVYLQFTSTTSLGLKWSGEMYVEVKSTHAVPPDKQDGLRRARLPVVEVVVPGTLEYEIADEDTTDSHEATHVRRVQNVLRKGYLAGRIISDRSSAEYLEQEVERLGHALRQSRQDTVEAERRGNAALQRLTQAAERETRLQSTMNDLTVQEKQAVALAIDRGDKLHAESEKVRTVSQALRDANETIVVQKKELRILHGALWGLVVVMACVSIFLLYLIYFASDANESVQAEVAPPTEQAEQKPGGGSAAKAQPPVSPRQNGRAQ